MLNCEGEGYLKNCEVRTWVLSTIIYSRLITICLVWKGFFQDYALSLMYIDTGSVIYWFSTELRTSEPDISSKTLQE